MHKIRIYTEDKNRELIESIINGNFSGYSIVSQDGYWQGTKERSICIEILTDLPLLNAVYITERICREIKTINGQDAVIYTIEMVDFITV